MTKPNFSFEKKLWKKDFKFVAGADEVGRGCFAGPVVAAAVAFAPNSKIQISNFKNKYRKIIINDSKKLTEKQRERADEWIKKNSIGWGVGVGSVSQINRLGMAKATNSAFRRAVQNCVNIIGHRVDYLLIDAFYVPYLRGLRRPLKTLRLRSGQAKKQKNSPFSGRQMAIINGDEKSFSIAAASIVAKVYRDKMMASLGKKSKYKKYVWEKNKGYGTKEHRDAIVKYGVTKWHRRQFIKTFLDKT